MSSKKLTAYVGTYTTGESKGIYRFNLDAETGKIDDIELAGEMGNPTYLAISKDNKYLYSVAKIENEGGIAAFSIFGSSGDLGLLNYQVTEGAPPCHLSLDSKNNYVLSANYHKGQIIAFPLNSDGSIDNPSSEAFHKGSGPNEKRQNKAYAHYVSLTPDEKYVCAVDLGIDKMVVYEFKEGILTESEERTLTVRPGSGPRHLAFHPSNKFAYILTELTSEVIALEYSAADNTFRELQYAPALPEDFTGENLGSAIQVSPDGKFLYTSNRGHESIAVFKIDTDTGKVQCIQHVSTEGVHPRDFSLDPTGSYLIVANQNTNNLVPFKVDKETGKLTRTAEVVNIPSPVCIKFLN
jgi:6-phosphogluconolactonase